MEKNTYLLKRMSHLKGLPSTFSSCKTQKELSESKKLIAAQVAQIGELNTEIEGLQKRNDTNDSDSSLLSQKDEEIDLLKSDKVELNRKISEQEILIKKLQGTKD